MAASLKKEADRKYSVTGDLNFSSVPDLWRDSSEQFRKVTTAGSSREQDSTGNNTIVIDLSGVSRSDSSGLALLIEWMRLSKKTGLDIQFQNIPQQMQNIAKVCGVADKLPLA